jgi:hypothetical protein
MINAPVLHVNGDYPQGSVISLLFFLCAAEPAPPEVARAMETAFKYRNFFRKVGDPEETTRS